MPVQTKRQALICRNRIFKIKLLNCCFQILTFFLIKFIEIQSKFKKMQTHNVNGFPTLIDVNQTHFNLLEEVRWIAC